MIVFRKREELIESREKAESIRKLLLRMGGVREPSHEAVVELFIEFAELETAVADMLCMDGENVLPLSRALRELALLCGEILRLSWTGKTDALRPVLLRFRENFETIFQGNVFKIPEFLCVRVSEGYVHYGIFPEMYIQAAEKFWRERRPRRAVCIGIRSIGTGLSAAVGAVLKHYGCEVYSFTLRPRGHPFDRKINSSRDFDRALESFKADAYLIVDEGPGLSGSSLCSTAEKLSSLGIDDARIVIFPCWEPDGKRFVSKSAASRWERHRKYSASFEEAWFKTDKLTSQLPGRDLRDISAGGWRTLFYAGRDAPAVHPNYEQRKYLCAGNGNRYLAKFAGLGRYGRRKYSRMEKLVETGLVTAPHRIVSGFLITDFTEGRPFMPRDCIRKDLVNSMAGYLAFIRKTFKAREAIPADEMIYMIKTNVREGLGEGWPRLIDKMDTLRAAFDAGEPVEIDGRMFPHEWIRTEQGYLKADGVDHHMDQFFPGSQDCAWDVAGSCFEFGFDKAQRDFFIDRYQSLTGDKLIRWKLPFYSIAYLSFRLGYAVLCYESLGETEDALKFRRMADGYRRALRGLITLHA